jgi:Rieske Fe-S protein
MADHTMERRTLLKVLCASTGSLCGTLAACGSAPQTPEQVLVSLPPVMGGKVEIPLEMFPMLREVGGGVVGRAHGFDDPLAITRQGESSFFAFTAMCTHMACVVRYNALNATLDCPCHGSTFELDGTVLSGPATKPLKVLPTDFDGHIVGVTTG